MRSPLEQIRKLYGKFFGIVDYLRSPFLLAVRLYWGWQLIESGWGKLHNLSKIAGFFASLGCRLLAVDSVIAKRLKPREQ